MKNLHLAFVALVFAFSAAKAYEQLHQHSNYLQALSDLRAAKWLIEHRPGNWELTNNELKAIKQIDETIKRINGAAIDDNKSIDDHPAVDEKPARIDRLHEADEFLKKAHADIAQENDNSFGNGLRNNSCEHIDAATLDVKTAIYLN